MPDFTRSIAPMTDRPAPRGQVVLPNSRSIATQQSVRSRNRPPFDVDKFKSIVPLSTGTNPMPLAGTGEFEILYGATQGTPGTWLQHPGYPATVPADITALNAMTINPGARWNVAVTAGAPGTPVGSYVVLGDNSHYAWNGTAWVTEAAFEDPTQWANLAAIQASNWTGGANWTVGQFLAIAAAAHVYWNGTAWLAGNHP
jgi:hypothetical protein